VGVCKLAAHHGGCAGARARLLDADVARVALPVEAQLARPLKVGGGRGAGLDQAVDHVARVHLERDQRHDLRARAEGRGRLHCVFGKTKHHP
jgi:hypothetical protein